MKRRTRLSLVDLFLAASLAACGGAVEAEVTDPAPPPLALVRAEPASVPTAGSQRVRLFGKHLQPGARLFLDGEETPLAIQSEDRAVFTPAPRAGRIGPVVLSIVNPSGERAEARGLFSYSATHLVYEAPIAIELPLQALDAVARDFNHDGHLDVAAIGLAEQELPESAGRLMMRMGQPDGSFGPSATYEVGLSPRALASADLNGDTLPDLVLLTQPRSLTSPTSVRILLSQRGGLSTLPPAEHKLSCQATALLLADLDGDSHIDLVAHCGESAAVLWGDGRGSFAKTASKISLANLGCQGEMASVDLDSDQRPDLLFLCRRQSGSVRIVRHRAPREFQPAKDATLPFLPLSIVAWHADGKPQLAISGITELSPSAIGKLYRASWNAASGLDSIRVMDLREPAKLSAVAKVDRDDLPDLILAGPGPSVLFQQPDGAYEEAPWLAPSEPLRIIPGDFNREPDGNQDLLVLPFLSNRLYLLFGDGMRRFSSAELYIPTVGATEALMQLADINSDDRDDIVVAGSSLTEVGAPDAVQVLFQRPDGTFVPQRPHPVEGSVVSVLTGLFNQDLVPDVAVVAFSDPQYGNIHAQLLLTKPDDRTFVASSEFAPRQYPESAVSGDFNGDGALDLVTANRSGEQVSAFLSDGKGALRLKEGCSKADPTYWAANQILAARLDADAHLDLVVVHGYSDGAADVLLGDGRGCFSAVPWPLALSGHAAHLAAADVNSDGRMDLLSLEKTGPVSLYLGEGNGRFAGPAQVSQVLAVGHELAVGDLDGDSLPDLALLGTIQGAGSQLVLLRGDGNGGFASWLSLAAAPCSRTLAIRDLDHDGRPELILATRSTCAGPIVTVLRNRSL